MKYSVCLPVGYFYSDRFANDLMCLKYNNVYMAMVHGRSIGVSDDRTIMCHFLIGCHDCRAFYSSITSFTFTWSIHLGN